MDYIIIIKLFHVIAVIIFLGNITLSPFWKARADRTKDRLYIVHTLRSIIKADRYFTMPGVTLLILFGIGSGAGFYNFITTGWLFWSIILLLISSFGFMAKVVPLQKKMLKLCDDEKNFNWDDYSLLSKKWDFWGTVSTLTPWIALILMILKPNI